MTDDMPTAKRRKATTTYVTEAGQRLEAVRLNASGQGIVPVYAVLIDGEQVGTMRGQRGHYSWPGQASYLTEGALTVRALFDAASSLSGRTL